MTREEAISIMKVIVHMLEEKYDTDRVEEAVDMAIEALQQMPSISEDGTLTVNVEDGSKVSRVLVCGDNHFGGLYYPEQEPCDKCVYSTSEGCQYDDITETIQPFETSDDAIRRQAVLDAINTDWHEDLSQLIDAIKALPPVEPKLRTGRWIKNKYGQTVCSECQTCALEVETGCLVNRHLAPFETKYCPQCGAKMSEGSEKE